MSKFKKDDKVRVVVEGANKGKIGTVTEQAETYDKSEWYYVNIEGKEYLAPVDWIEEFSR